MNNIRKVSFAFIGLLALPMASPAKLPDDPQHQRIAIEASLRQLPSVQVFLGDYFVLPILRGLSFRMQWTADGQPMPSNLEKFHAECILHSAEALSCEALKNWFRDPPRYGGRQPVKSPDQQAFFIPNMEFDTEYCFRFRPDDDPWTAWTCARTPVKPALPLAPRRPVLTTIAESSEIRVNNAAHPFAIYVEWDAVPHEDSLTDRYVVEKRDDRGIFIGNSGWIQRLAAVSSYHQTLELPGYDPDGEYFIRVCAVNIAGSSCSPAAKTLGRAWAEQSKSYKAILDSATPKLLEKNDHSAAAALLRPDPTIASTVAESDQSIATATALAHPAPTVAFARVQTTGPAPPICDAAKSARARNSPAAPGLERQCNAYLAAHPAPLPPLDPVVVDALAASGAQIAAGDPDVAAARTAVADADYQRGFDVATGIFGDPALGAQGNTLMGPGSARIRDSLPAVGQSGFNDSVQLHLRRHY